MKNRLPRKLKKKVPKNTPYCYKFKEFLEDGLGYKITPCPLFTYKLDLDGEYIGYCKYLKCEIDDQCKSCGIE